MKLSTVSRKDEATLIVERISSLFTQQDCDPTLPFPYMISWIFVTPHYKNSEPGGILPIMAHTGEAPARGTIFRLQVYERLRISLCQKRVTDTFSGCEKVEKAFGFMVYFHNLHLLKWMQR